MHHVFRGTRVAPVDNDQWTVPATIDDPAILEEIGSA
jgi:hypothetical protein